MDSEKSTKVIFQITGEKPEDQWIEILSAEPLGNNQYIIQNSPFHAYGVSYLDKIQTENEFKGLPLFKEIIEKSGHSTFRVIVFKEITHPLFQQFWQPLEDHGCTYISANNKLISVNVPPEVDYKEVFKLLEGGDKLGIWDFEEADSVQGV